jgi:hypothetical protein
MRTFANTRVQRDVCVPRTRRLGLGAMPRRVVVDLTPDAVEQVATRVVELLQESERHAAPKPMTAGQLARHLQVDRPWVYKHRRLLGGWPINDGPKAQWRFDPDVAMERFRRHAAARGVDEGA